ncbi:MAG: ABC transporter substrate-binding protein [Thermoproteota archaeon]
MKAWRILASGLICIMLLISMAPQSFTSVKTATAQEEKSVWIRPFSYNPPPVGHFNYFIGGSIAVFDWVFELMTHYFAANGTYIPCVAESWQLDPDYMWFQVKLRKGVKFHDGHELTYKDVLATLYCVYLLKDRLWYYIKDVEIIDDYTIKFNFKEKTDYPVFYILWHWMIVSYNQYGQIADKVQARIKEGKDIFAKTEDFQDLINELNQFRPETPIGCGPYKLKSITETMIVLEAFENYWNGKPPIDEIHLVRYATTDLLWEALIKGEAHYVWAVSPSPEILDRLLKENKYVWTIRVPRPVGITLYINKAKYPLNLVEVRRALAYAINRTEMGWVQYTGGCIPSKYVIGFHVPDLTRYLNQSFINQYLKDFEYAYNPAKAEQILQGLGFRKGADNIYVTPNGTKLEFTLITQGGWINAPAAENLKAQLEKVGIKINVQLVDTAVWTDALYRGAFDLLGAVYGSPGFSFDEYYHKYMVLYPGHDPAKTWGQIHRVPWKTQPVNVTELTKKIALFPAQISQAELTEIYSTLSYITGDQVPVINLYQPAVVIMMDKRFSFPTDPGYWNGLGSYELHGLRPLFVFGWLKPKVNLTVESVVGGTLSIAPGRYEYGKGDKVTITATPASRYRFERWEVDGTPAGTDTTLTITMDKSHRVKAVFSAIIYKTLTVLPVEGGTLSIAPGSYEYETGQTVTITATPSSGYTFERWEVDGTPAGTSTTLTITMDRDHTVKAVFARIPYEMYIGVVAVIAIIAVAAYFLLKKRGK